MNRSVRLTLLGLGAWLLANAVLLGLWDQGEGAGSGAARDDSGWSSAAPGMQTGIIRRLYTDPAGTAHRYVVFVPAGTPSNLRWPVILYLNGYGKNGSDGIAPLRDGLAPVIWESKATFPFLVVFPQCREGGSWAGNGADAERALAILDQVSLDFPVDTDRVSVTGLSAGGSGVWSLASRWPERFAAIAPLSAGGMDVGAAPEFARREIPIWMFWVRKDDRDLVQSSRAMYQALVDAGADVRCTEVDGGGHPHNSWDFAFRNPAFLDWLVNQSQRTRRNPSADREQESVALIEGPDLTGWSVSSGTWECDSRRLVRGTADDAGTAVLVRNTDTVSASFELSGEFDWSPSGRTGEDLGESGDATSRTSATGPVARTGKLPVRGCGIGLLSGAEGEASGVLWRIVDPDHGSGGLYDIGRRDWRAADDPVSQRSLRRDGWNEFRIRVERGSVQAWINGREAFVPVETAPVENISRISLQVDGAPGVVLRFRNLRLKSFSGDKVDVRKPLHPACRPPSPPGPGAKGHARGHESGPRRATDGATSLCGGQERV